MTRRIRWALTLLLGIVLASPFMAEAEEAHPVPLPEVTGPELHDPVVRFPCEPPEPDSGRVALAVCLWFPS